MYRVVYATFNQRRSKEFNTLKEAFEFWSKLPFESFIEMYKIGS